MFIKIDNYIFPTERIDFIKYNEEEHCIEVYLINLDFPKRFYHHSIEDFELLSERVDYKDVKD